MLSILFTHLCVCVCAHTQGCLIFFSPMDCSLSGSSVHGISQARILEQVAISTLGIFPTQGLNPCLLHLLHWQVGSLPVVLPEKPSKSTQHCKHSGNGDRSCYSPLVEEQKTPCSFLEVCLLALDVGSLKCVLLG